MSDKSQNGEGTKLASVAALDLRRTLMDDAPTPAIEPLKALSLWQPWASLIAIGAKSIETRKWSTDHRGLVAILSTKKTPRDEFNFAMANAAITDAIKSAGLDAENLPAGAVVAVAELADCIEFTEGFDPGEPEKHFGDFTPGRHGLMLKNVRRLPVPIRSKGSLGMFALPDDVDDQVRAAIADLASALPTDESPRLCLEHGGADSIDECVKCQAGEPIDAAPQDPTNIGEFSAQPFKSEGMRRIQVSAATTG